MLHYAHAFQPPLGVRTDSIQSSASSMVATPGSEKKLAVLLITVPTLSTESRLSAPGLDHPLQSGSLTAAYLHLATELHIGVSFFLRAQTPSQPSPSAPFAWADSGTLPASTNATQAPCGMANRLTLPATHKVALSTQKAGPYAQTGSAQLDAPATTTMPDTSALDVDSPLTARKNALGLRKLNPLTPYKPDAWERALTYYHLISKYPTLPRSMRRGFNFGIPRITQTFTPPNGPSIETLHAHFCTITDKEFTKGRYLGPFTRSQTESLIGPFQTSPLSLIPKASNKDSYRLVQNLSFPYTASGPNSSINSAISSDEFPTTWGTFNTVALVIANLPPGSQAAVRDVAEAYRTIPVSPDQWPGIVVRLQGPDSFAIDTSGCFGLASASGVYGQVADAGADIFRSAGIGPLSKWVDDHIFFRIRREHLKSYNSYRVNTRNSIRHKGGKIYNGGRLWYRGSRTSDGREEEFDEDVSTLVQDLSSISPRSPEEKEFTYGMGDIDRISSELGIPWEASKDIPFGVEVPFIGLQWNLETRMVLLPEAKKTKYIKAIQAWESSRTHILEETQKLHGKLLHASLVIPAGRAYLTGLERMLALFHDSPFMPRTPPRSTPSDLQWWKNRLQQPSITRPIPGTRRVLDLQAFSDAASETGIGIVIGDRWQAWRLQAGWDKDGKDIAWAEAVGFELLVRTIIAAHGTGNEYRVYGDNTSVVEGWWKGCSRNKHVNGVFRRIHDLSEEAQSLFHAFYIPSGSNPADNPSRGNCPALHLRLPVLRIPPELESCITHHNPESSPERSTHRQRSIPTISPRHET
jgi:hypothetical protein